MVEMYIPAFSQFPWYETWTPETALGEITRSIEAGYEFMICRIGEQVVGFGIGEPFSPDTNDDHQTLLDLGLSPNSYYVGELVTHQNFRKMGVCSGIMRTLINHARDSLHSEICLRTRENNEALFGVMKGCDLQEYARYDAVTGGVCSKRIIFHLKFT